MTWAVRKISCLRYGERSRSFSIRSTGCLKRHSSSICIRANSNRPSWAVGLMEIRTSMSLSGWKSARKTEPNKENSLIAQRLQNSAIFLRGRRNFLFGIALVTSCLPNCTQATYRRVESYSFFSSRSSFSSELSSSGALSVAASHTRVNRLSPYSCARILRN